MKNVHSQKGFTPIAVLLGIAVLLAVFWSVYYGGRRGLLKTAQVSKPSATTPASTVDATHDWKFYNNSEFGFSIAYPPTWSLRIEPERPSHDQELAHAFIEGPEGKIQLDWGSGLGGACDPDGWVEVQTLIGIAQACYGVDQNGIHHWSGFTQRLSSTTGFGAFAQTNSSSEADKNTILKIFSTLKFTGDPYKDVPTESKVYKSTKLGIEFHYKTQDDSRQVHEIGNKAYIHSANEKPEKGQYVEVFTKDHNDTLEVAIKKKFLEGYSEKDCFVKAATDTKNPQLVKAVIAFPVNTDPAGPWWANGDRCPRPYSVTNGITYFVMDKNHPDKYAYVSVGQYIIESGIGDKPWQDTITFTN